MRKVMFYVTFVVLMTAQILSAGEISSSKSSKKSVVENNDVRKSVSIVKEDAKDRSVIPQTMAYQGVIKEDGLAVNGNQNLIFSIYSTDTGGTALWTEDVVGVPVSEGVFNVILGSITPITLDFTVQYYIGVRINGGAELSPRVQLTTSPYAFNSKTADTAMNVDNDVVVYDINGKQNNVVITGGDNVTVDNSGNDIVINADLSGVNDELVKVGTTGDAGYLSSTEFSSTTKRDNRNNSKKETTNSKEETRGVISLKTGSISESKLNIFNAPDEGDVLVYGGDPINKMVWVAPEFAVDGDDLGNHTATTNIQLNDKWITNSGVDNKGLKIDDNGMVTVGRSSNDGIRITYAGDDGIQIDSCDFGIYVKQANVIGIDIQTANNGVQVRLATNDGVLVEEANNDGFQINSAGDDGVYINSTVGNGVHVDYAGSDGVYANTTNSNQEWGFNTPDKAFIGAGVSGAKMFSIGKNTGNQTLEPGDLVVISGGYEKAVLGEDNGNPVINVKKADNSESNSIFGVVEYSVDIKTKIKELDDGESISTKSFRKADNDNANTGDYLSIVILGPTDVKVGDRSQNIEAGEPVKLGNNAGVRKIKSTTINGIEIFENGGIVGKALESSNGKGMIKVFVNCK